MFDMINIFEVFLPQLLRYPNPTDPLNGEAAALLMREPRSYDARVKGEYPLHDRTARDSDTDSWQSTSRNMLPTFMTKMTMMITNRTVS